MNVEEFEEYQQWVKGKSDSYKSHCKSQLRNFCEYHEMNPEELIREAHGEESESDKPWLEENAAEQRLLDWHEHLIKPKGKGGRGISRNSARMYWRIIKSFYGKFNIDIAIETPKAGEKNHKPELDAQDVEKIVDSATSLRDRAMILVGFQAGMGPQEICRLDVGQVKPKIDVGKCPIPIEKTRKKSQVRHESWIHRDAIEALKRYLEQREEKEGELDKSEPLFVKERKKKGDRRVTPDIIRKSMRRIKERVGQEISKVADKLDQQTNPLSFKFLRKAFGVACDNAGIPSRYKHYWLGHKARYNGAYSGLTRKKQREMYEKLALDLSISAPSREGEDLVSTVERVVEEKYGEVGVEKVMPEIRERIEGLDSRISEIEEEVVEKKSFAQGVMEEMFSDPEFEEAIGDKVRKVLDERFESN